MKTVLCGFCADDFLVNSMKITEYEVRSNLVSLKQDKQDKQDKRKIAGQMLPSYCNV